MNSLLLFKVTPYILSVTHRQGTFTITHCSMDSETSLPDPALPTKDVFSPFLGVKSSFFGNQHCLNILFPSTNYNQKNFLKKKTTNYFFFFFKFAASNLLDTGQKVTHGNIRQTWNIKSGGTTNTFHSEQHGHDLTTLSLKSFFFLPSPNLSYLQND